MFVVHLVLTEHFFTWEFDVSKWSKCLLSLVCSRGLAKFGTEHPPAESGIKTKEYDNGTIGTFFVLERPISAIHRIIYEAKRKNMTGK